MTATPSVDGTNNAPVKEETEPHGPPDEKTWKYYSQHHEMPVSGVSSLAVHIFVIGVIIVGGLLAAKFASGDKPVDIEVAEAPGGGGSPEGDASSKGMASPHGDETASEVKQLAQPKPVEPTPQLDQIKPVEKAPLTPDTAPAERAIQDDSQKALAALSQQAQQMEQALSQATGSKPGRGQGGPGGGGGKGSSYGPGEGPGTGPGKLTKTEKRRLRWELNFTYYEGHEGEDLLNQFAALGAWVAVPEASGGFRVFRELRGRHPEGTHTDDLTDIHRIGWSDEKPTDTNAVAGQLGMRGAPYILAFFPRELEDKLAAMEEQFRGLREDQIREKMKFKVESRGLGFEVIIDPDQSLDGGFRRRRR
jgi:hypothetical protein